MASVRTYEEIGPILDGEGTNGIATAANGVTGVSFNASFMPNWVDVIVTRRDRSKRTVYSGRDMDKANAARAHWTTLMQLAFLLLLSLLGASVASAQDGPFAFATKCKGSLSVWSGTMTATGGRQSLLVGSRAEGGCDLLGLELVRVFGRADFYPVPGRTVDFTAPNLESVAAVEAWGGVAIHVKGALSLAAFGGVQKSLEGGQLGIGGATQSLCVGGRLDYGGGLAVAGMCSRYSPAQTFEDGKRVDGPALVGTVVLPVKKGVKLAANGAYLLRTRDYVIAAGPTVGF